MVLFKRFLVVVSFLITVVSLKATAQAEHAGYVAYVDEGASIVVVQTNYDVYICA